MTDISDELRKVADEYDVLPLYTLADRIDREMFVLPKTADGVPIHLGDTVYLDDGREAKVTRIGIGMDEDSIYTIVYGDDFSLTPGYVNHERPDSWERIADELDEQAGSLTKDGYTWQEDAIHDFADRIRKLAKEED